MINVSFSFGDYVAVFVSTVAYVLAIRRVAFMAVCDYIDDQSIPTHGEERKRG